LTWLTLHDLLAIAFAVGVWLSADGSRAQRWAAGFLLAASVITAPLHPFFPMSSRGMGTGFNDTMHLVLTMAFSVLVFGAMVASVVAIRGWFRLYAIASLVLMMAFGGLTGPLMSDIANSQPTPWLGTFERINAYTMFAWIVVLAVVLIRRTVGESNPGPERASMPASADRGLAKRYVSVERGPWIILALSLAKPSGQPGTAAALPPCWPPASLQRLY